MLGFLERAGASQEVLRHPGMPWVSYRLVGVGAFSFLGAGVRFDTLCALVDGCYILRNSTLSRTQNSMKVKGVPPPSPSAPVTRRLPPQEFIRRFILAHPSGEASAPLQSAPGYNAAQRESSLL